MSWAFRFPLAAIVGLLATAPDASILRRMQVSADVLKVGDRVRLAGNPGRRSRTDFFAHNLLLPG